MLLCSYRSEEISLKVSFDSHQFLYHGTIDLYGRIISEHGIHLIKRPRGDVDFGPGFYVTVGLKSQAVKWAKDKANNPNYSKDALDIIGMTIREFFDIKDSVKPVVLKFRITNPEMWTNLEHILFQEDNVEWKKFVFQHRKEHKPPNKHWIFGPVADGGLSGNSSRSIIALPGYNQMSLHSSEALNMLELIEVITC